MGHTIAQKEHLIARVRTLKENLCSLEEAIGGSLGSDAVLKLVAKNRTLLNGLMADILEDHLRVHVLQGDCELPKSSHAAAEGLIEVVHTYMGR